MKFLEKHFAYIMAAMLIAALYAPFAQADYAMPQAQQLGGITYVTGGIGDEERDALKSVRNNYNLAIMSAGNSGAFVGDTHIIISDPRGQELLSTDAGPIFYAKLPAGRYVVEGLSEGQSRTQTVTVASNQPSDIHFSWK